MSVFQVALTGDFLDESGSVAYGDVGLNLLQSDGRIGVDFIRPLAPSPGDSSYWSRLYSLEVAPEHICGVHGLVVLRPWVRQSTFQAGADDLVVIGRSGAGYDKIDLEACTAHDVALFNAPQSLNHSTASSALMFMLALAKKLPQQDRVVRQGRWDLQASVMGSEIAGRVIGIIGLGRSGRELARLVAPFGVRLLAYSPHADTAAAAELGVELVSLDRLLRTADFVSLHCRLTDDTRRLIGAAQLELMKPTAYLVNVARGEVLDQAALVAALRTGRIAGAALDVFDHEPLPTSDPLTQFENVILAPHWSCSTSDVWRSTGRAMAEGMVRAAHGELPDNIVNTEVVDRAGFRAKLGRFAGEI